MNIIRYSLLLLFLSAHCLLSQTPDEFKQRRDSLREFIGNNELIILKSNEIKMRNSDISYEYRQDSDFYYLTGHTAPNSLVLISKTDIIKVKPEAKPLNELLLIPDKNPQMETWTGKMLGFDEARTLYKFNEVASIRKQNDILTEVLKDVSNVYVNASIRSRRRTENSFVTYLENLKNEASLQFSIKSVSQFINQLRAIKSKAEIEIMRKSIDITALAFKEAAKSAEPEMHEYELEAVIEYVYKKSGAERCGFPSIVGSGENSCILHYEKNNAKIEDGDLILFDIGAEYKMYSADISRTIPANGTFTDRQKQIYQIVLKANEETIKAIKPGVPYNILDQTSIRVIAEGLHAIGLIDDPSDTRAARKYTLHGVSHPLGLDTHDVFSRNSRELKPGMVLTVEPGIYIPEEKIGIRIEDDVLVTDTGYEVLSKSAPKTVKEIENLMKGKGLGNIVIK